MLFNFNAHSALLLPFVLPGLALAGYLALRAWRQSSAPDALLALLLLLNVLPVAQWMLGYAGWYDSHDRHSSFMFYMPWRPGLGLGPVLYLYFVSLTNQEFSWRRQARHLWPLAVYVGLYGLAALYDLGLLHGLRGQPLPLHFGTKGWLSQSLDGADIWLQWLSYPLLLGYGLATLRRYRRYRRYLDDHFSDTEQLRFAGFRNLLQAALLFLLLGLGVRAVEALSGGYLSYDGYWYAFVGNGVLLYFLMVVGLQANGAARVPLRFEDGGAGTPAAAPLASARPPAAEAEPLASPQVVPVAVSSDAVPATPAPAALAAALEADAPAPGPAEAGPATGLPPELHPWRTRLLALMAEEQPWLEPELTLGELAHRLRTNTSVLSRVINAGCGQNFNDFVNGYRVAEAERKLADPRLAHYSLVGVALESGFNSKSTFNRVFKKLRGVTPSEIQRGGAKS